MMHSGPFEDSAGTSAASALSRVGSSVGKYPFLTVAGEPREHEGHGNLLALKMMDADMRACMSDAKTSPPLRAVVPRGCGWRACPRRARRCGSGRPAPGQRRHVDGEPMTFKRPEGEGQARQHRLRLQQFQHAVAPGIEKRQRAGILHQLPQPVEPVRGIARQERQRAGVGLVGLDAAPIEQPDVGQRAEQRVPYARALRFSRFSTLPTKTGMLAPCSVMTWN